VDEPHLRRLAEQPLECSLGDREHRRSELGTPARLGPAELDVGAREPCGLRHPA